MMHRNHMAICAALIVVAVMLTTVGAGAFAFVPALGCLLMMGMMVWMMVRAGRHT